MLAVAAVAMLLLAAPTRAAVHPAGGGAFEGGAEGWTVTEASCTLPVLCTVDGGYDGGAGNPPGSIASTASIPLNALTLVKATTVLESPDFKAAEGGSYALRLDRQFTQGSAVDLAPQVSYTVSLLDRTTGTEAKAVTEMVTATSPFTGKEAPVPVVAGHTYAIRIVAETSSTLAGVGLGRERRRPASTTSRSPTAPEAGVVTAPAKAATVGKAPTVAMGCPASACSRCCAPAAAAPRSSKACASSSRRRARPRSGAAAASPCRDC